LITTTDIGCLVARAQAGELPVESRSFVIDYDTAKWLDAGAAYYLLSPELPTPMSYGIAAFARGEGANVLAEQYAGQVMDWRTLLEEFKP